MIAHHDEPDDEGLADDDTAASSESLAFLRAVAHVPEVEPIAPDLDDSGTRLAGRFALGRRIGSGGFGTVYEAFDEMRGATVALKVLRRTDPHAIYLFKHEFRSLLGLVHPRLVRLYELHQDDRRWFFTMELIAGAHLITHLAGGEGPDHARIRETFAELVEGLGWLHERGKLHRDVKPSNVMVDAGGAVKILDFGLIVDVSDTAPAARVGGTPSYMAPEQAAGLATGPAADFYAVGVMLHEALTGSLPRADGPRSPRAIAPSVPDDLDRLCRDLLAKEPEKRPSFREIVARLAGSAPSLPPPRTTPPAPFVGRDAELAAALREARDGATVIALVHGASGLGKSALVQELLDRTMTAKDAPSMILSGRCFQQESVPYKAVDAVVDALGRRLARASSEELAAWLPDGVAALGRLFPVLRQVPEVAAAKGSEADNPLEQRRAAFAALRDLLARIARTHTLVIAIDDLQWGDLDSIALLVELLRPPASPPLLLVAAYRADEAATNPVLSALSVALRGDLATGVRTRNIAVGELDEATGAALARALLGAKGRDDIALRIASEARMSPFFITELARWASDADEGLAAPALSSLLDARIARLPSPSRRLLQVVALAGQPIPRSIAARAAETEGALLDEPEALSTLLAAQLVRVQGTHEMLAPYHDRVGDAVKASIAPALRRDLGGALARSLEASGRAEPQVLAHHFREAGLTVQAAKYALAAAEQARLALAFEKAARFFREAIELGALPEADDLAARIGLASALTSAGRPRDAAEAYLDVASRSAPRDALAHRRFATQLLISGGYVDEGADALDELLAESGLSRPRSTLEAVVKLVAMRARIAIRGHGTRERPEHEIPDRLLLEIDACFAAASSLGSAAPFHVAPFHARQLWLALEAGDPHRLARAYTLESMHSAMLGGLGAQARTEALLARTKELASKVDRPEARAFHTLASGLVAYVHGDVDAAERLLRDSISGLGVHRAAGGTGVDMAQAMLGLTLWLQGKNEGFATVTAELLADARERGNRFRETMVRLCSGYLLDLAADAPAAARANVRAAMERWSRTAFHLQHLRELLALTEIALYEGDGELAIRTILSGVPRVITSGLVALRALRAELHHVRGIAAVAAAHRGGVAARAFAAIALQAARALEGGDVRWGAPIAAVIRAGIAAQRGRAEEAIRRAETAEAALAAIGFTLHATAIRRIRGVWLGEDGRALVASADSWMKARAIASPARLAAMLTGNLDATPLDRDGGAERASRP